MTEGITTGAVHGGLLERADLLTALGDALSKVSRRTGRLALVTGEAGAGKTELLRQFREDASRSARFLWATCDALFTPRPLGPLLDIGALTGGALQAQVTTGAAPHDVAMTLLRELDAPMPTALVIEDLHWADEATLDVVRLLARRLDTVPVLLVLSFRDEHVQRTAPLRLMLGELPAGGVTRLAVPPLSRETVAALAHPAGLDADALFARTGGNPFFVSEVLAAREDAIPESVRDAVLARAARLSAPARTLLESLSVVPQRTEVWLLEALAPEQPGNLDECLASGMLRAAGDGVEFRHELARLAIQDALPPDRRVALHRRALAALADPPGVAPDLARLAHHAEAAGDAVAVRRYAARAAARAASLGAHREAAAHYAQALRFADADRPGERAELLQHRWQECFLTDQYREGIDALQEALEHHRSSGDRRREGDLLRALSQTLWCRGGASEARSVALDAVGLLESLPPGRETAMAYANLAAVYRDEDDLDAARSWAARAIELAQDLAADDIHLHALATVGSVDLMTGAPQGAETLDRSLALARRAGLHDQAARAFVLGAGATVRRREHALCERYLSAGIAYCADHGIDLFRHYLLAYQARSLLDQGRWEEATDPALAVLLAPRNSTVPRINALVVVGLVRARRGDPGAEEPIQEALALAEPTAELQRLVPAAAAMAELAWLSGDEEAAGRAAAGPMELALQRRSPWLVGELAYWGWRAGAPPDVPPGDLAPPYAAHLSGDPAQAAELWAGLGCPYEAALARADAPADDDLRAALGELQGIGARRTAAIVSRRLRSRGARNVPRGPHARTRQNPAGLTGRELEVLTALATGLTNAGIAARLTLSQKTVQHHVSAILRKLGAPNRAAATAEAHRLGLLEPPRP